MEYNVKKRILLFLCAALLAVPAVSCGNKDKGEGTGHLYNAPLLGNPQSLDPQFANDPASNTVIKNLYSGLVMKDLNGNISCCNAESYTISSDGLVYTFKLRQDNYWFLDKNNDDHIGEDEYFPVTADDYVFALQRVLNPKMQSPYAKDFSCIKGGERILNGSAPAESAGVSAKDDFTLEIVLDYPSAEFLGMLAEAAASPCNKEFFDSTKGRYGLDDKSVMSNGAFYVRQWFYDPYGSHNILYMRRNEINVNELYTVAPSYLSFTIENTENDIRECFKNNEIDCFTTLNDSYSSKKYSVTQTSATTLGLIFNPDDKYFRNANLRKAIACSIDRSNLESKLDSDLSIAYGIIPPAVQLAGKSYREASSDRQFDFYNLSEAQNCFEKAKRELKVGSVDSIKILVCAETVDSGYLHYLSQSWQESLGLYVGIEDVTASEFNSRINAGDYTIALYPLKGILGSGLSVLEQFEQIDCLKSASDGISHSDEIIRCTSVAELVDQYTYAENSILAEFGFIPVFYKNSYLIAGKDNEDIIYDPFTGAVDYRIAKNYS